MTNLDIEAIRARIADSKAPKSGRKKVHIEPEVSHFESGSVLAFDQSLTKTGWSWLLSGGGRIVVAAAGVLDNPMRDYKGFEQTFRRHVRMSEMIDELLAMYGYGHSDVIAHEMPAVQGYRTESSLMAAGSIHVNAAKRGLSTKVTMISRLQAYATLVGSRGATKAEGTKVVERLCERQDRGVVTRWNQDVHDSVLVGLMALWIPESGR